MASCKCDGRRPDGPAALVGSKDLMLDSSESMSEDWLMSSSGKRKPGVEGKYGKGGMFVLSVGEGEGLRVWPRYRGPLLRGKEGAYMLLLGLLLLLGRECDL